MKKFLFMTIVLMSIIQAKAKKIQFNKALADGLSKWPF